MKRLLFITLMTVAALTTSAVAQDKQTASANSAGADGTMNGRAFALTALGYGRRSDRLKRLARRQTSGRPRP